LQTTPARDSANLYRLDFATGRSVLITRVCGGFVRSFSRSSDGRLIVFERSGSPSGDAPAELWVAQLDGSNARLLVKDAILPSWGRTVGR
jgi:Tol biopolymer transport system component